MRDLSLINRPIPTYASDHAIVIGSGIAGLLAARVLTDHFSRVTIIERDRLPAGREFRKGVPQAHHTHYLMIRGRLILEQLFPGFEAEMVAAGATVVDLAADMVWLCRVGLAPRFRSGLTTFFASRNLMEWGVRQRLMASSKVRFVEACDVTGLLPSVDTADVKGVQVRFRDRPLHASDKTGTLDADLVVDASGYNSHAPQWLEALGYPAPPETVVKPFRGYATRYYAIPPGLKVDWKVLIIQSRPPLGTRYGQLFPMEGDRWMLTLIGAAGDHPPIDEAGFLEFVRSLPSSHIYEAIKDAQPVSPIYGYQHTENRLRSYDQMATWPDGFVSLGDAVCTLNPSYAQGITTAALGALTLNQCLRAQRYQHADLYGLARRFQRSLAATNAPFWQKSVSDDLRYAKTVGAQRNWHTRFTHWYIDRTLELAMENHEVYNAFVSWMQLLTPLKTLFRPPMMLQVLRHAIGRREADAAQLWPQAAVAEDAALP